MEFSLQHPSGRYPQIAWTEAGKECRKSTGTHDAKFNENLLADVAAAARMKLDWRAVLNRKPVIKLGYETSWQAFRDLYRERLPRPRPKTWRAAEQRLDLCEDLMNPTTVTAMTDRETLKTLRDRLIHKYHSAHTAKSRFDAIKAALRWAAEEGLCPPIPDISGVSVSKTKKMKGRPLSAGEFAAYLKAVPAVVRERNAESWIFLIQGLKAQGLRIGEAMELHWTDANRLRPNLSVECPRIEIPAAMQKNDTEQDIPMLPDFVDLLKTVPKSKRVGFVFKPNPIRHELRHARTPDWAGKVLCKIGRESGILTDKKKYASAHDLRRTCAQDMIDAGCEEADVQLVMRHEDSETTKKWYATKKLDQSSRDIHRKMRGLPHSAALTVSRKTRNSSRSSVG